MENVHYVSQSWYAEKALNPKMDTAGRTWMAALGRAGDNGIARFEPGELRLILGKPDPETGERKPISDRVLRNAKLKLYKAGLFASSGGGEAELRLGPDFRRTGIEELPPELRPKVTYVSEVRSFDHSRLAGLPSYPAAQKAVDDLVHDCEDRMSLAEFLDIIRDMALAPRYSDACQQCGGLRLAQPYAGVREGDEMRFAYLCPDGHRWTCGYSINSPSPHGQ